MVGHISRRDFLKATGNVLALSLVNLSCREGNGGGQEAASATPVPGAADATRFDYGGFKNLYREKWTWDKVAKGTHYVNCWYQRSCNWNVYVKDGIVWREEQSGTYPQIDPNTPDFNPRGCQKGACYSERMYDAQRVQHPLKRTGERGEASWKRVSWDEALTDIADRIINAMVEDGPGSVVWDPGTGFSNGCNMLGLHRTVHALDTPAFSTNADVGDQRPGVAATFGKTAFCSSPDDLVYADCILIWGGNPIYTQIPQAHFITEARYKGAKIITIAPDLSASAIHADLWVPIKVATDAALALAICNEIIQQDLCDWDFVREQTDMALLVRSDTGDFLRESDLVKGGSEERFYFYDSRKEKVVQAPYRSLALGKVEPALDGEFSVETIGGSLTATPLFVRMREHLARYTPEYAAEITGVTAAVVRELARIMGNAKAMHCINQSNFTKFYHGSGMERSQALIFALTGNLGKRGAGYMSWPSFSHAGPEVLYTASGDKSPQVANMIMRSKMIPHYLKMRAKGLTPEMIVYDLAREAHRKGNDFTGVLWTYFHGGLQDRYGSSTHIDPNMGRPFESFLSESLEKGWQIADKDAKPRVFMSAGGNYLRRTRGYDRLLDHLVPRLDLLVTIDWRMSFTALHSDYVLPAAGWYEKDDIAWSTPLSPFAQALTAAVPPLSESKSDWAIHCLIVKYIERRAKERGIRSFVDRSGKQRDLTRVYQDFTFGERYREDNAEDMLSLIMEMTNNLGGVSWKELKRSGIAKLAKASEGLINSGNATDILPNEPITALRWHREKKVPWPTLTRRVQFCIEHPFYKELGEVLPVYKENPKSGGDHPLVLTGGHTRWSIHATWRDQKFMLQLNRGGPSIVISVDDAEARNIRDGMQVRVFNDIGSFELKALVQPSLRPGVVIVYHAWEPHQFSEHRSHQVLTPNPINPLLLAGGYTHLQPMPLFGEPGGMGRGVYVDVEAWPQA